MLSEKAREKDASVPKREQGYRVVVKVTGAVGRVSLSD